MRQFVIDDALRQNFSQKGLERAKLFRWEKSAQEHLRIFKDILDIPPRPTGTL
jgi:hypothetical protein